MNNDQVCAKDIERALTVEALWSYGADEDCEDKQQMVVEVKFLNDRDESKNTSNKNPMSDESSKESEDMRESELLHSYDTKSKGTWQMFKHQNSLKVKKIKICTSEEIAKARGMRASYLKFWNKRAKALCTKTPKKFVYAKQNEELRFEQEQILK